MKKENIQNAGQNYRSGVSLTLHKNFLKKTTVELQT